MDVIDGTGMDLSALDIIGTGKDGSILSVGLVPIQAEVPYQLRLLSPVPVDLITITSINSETLSLRKEGYWRKNSPVSIRLPVSMLKGLQTVQIHALGPDSIVLSGEYRVAAF
jgi:hypothetical protein